MPNITLKRFMIFNSNEGCDESREGDKLLYHWTKEAPDCKVSLTEQIDDICLCDASINVSNRLNCDTFYKQANHEGDILEKSNESSSSYDHTNLVERNKSLVLTFDSILVLVVLVEPSLSIWMAIHVSPPESGEGSQPLGQHHQNDPSCIPTDAIKRAMLNIYRRFCLLNGTFKMIADDVLAQLKDEQRTAENVGRIHDEKQRACIRDKLRTVCDTYFSSVLPEIHLNSMISNVASLYNYILYLDLNPLTLMKVNSFINHLVCIDAAHISHTIVIFNDRLLWSSLNMLDTRILYNYMISVLIRDALQEELSREVDKVRRIKDNMPIYLTEGPASVPEVNSSPTSRDGQADAPSTLIKSYLTVFRSSNNMTLGIILTEPDMIDLIEKCEQILVSDSRLGVIPLASLAQSVGQNYLRANSSIGSHPHHQPGSSSSQQQAASSSASSSSWRPTLGSSSNKGLYPLAEQKYVYMDRLYASISLPLSMDMQNKEHLLLTTLDNNGVEIPASSKKLRLIRYLIDLEPELYDLKQLSSTGGLVEEFYARTLNDCWLTVTNSKYRTIYSVNNIRNSGLCEAKQSAVNLKSTFANNRL